MRIPTQDYNQEILLQGEQLQAGPIVLRCKSRVPSWSISARAREAFLRSRDLLMLVLGIQRVPQRMVDAVGGGLWIEMHNYPDQQAVQLPAIVELQQNTEHIVV